MGLGRRFKKMNLMRKHYKQFLKLNAFVYTSLPTVDLLLAISAFTTSMWIMQGGKEQCREQRSGVPSVA
jgi:hypothetical protein